MSWGTSSTNNQQKTSVNDLNAGAKAGLDTSATASGTGFDFLHHAADTLQPAADYYSTILHGGSGADSALAPDVNRTRMAADQSRDAVSTLAPRGGGRGSVLFNSPMQENSQVQSIFNTARPQAAQGLTNVGAIEGGLGDSTLGTGTGYLSAGDTAANSGFNAGTTQYKQQQESGSAFGSAFGGIAQALIPLLA